MDTGMLFTTLMLLIVISHFNATLQSEFDFEDVFSGFEINQSESASSGSKRSSNSQSRPDETTMKNQKTLNYISKTSPLQPILSPRNIEFFKSKEEELSNTGNFYFWDLANLNYDRAKFLCIESFQKEYIGIAVLSGMSPDCDIVLTTGPSYSKPGSPQHIGYFVYYKPMQRQSREFYADFVRCNCAYTEFKQNGTLKTVKNSKRYFFLLKVSDTKYYVATMLRNIPRSAYVHVINTLELVKS